MDSQMSFADMLGLDSLDFQPEKKEKKAPAASKKVGSKKTKKGTKKSGSTNSYNLPVTLYTGYNEPIIIDKACAEKAGIKKDSVTVDDIKKVAVNIYPMLDSKYMACDVNKDKAYMALTVSIQKGTVKVKSSTKVYLPNMAVAPSLDSIMDGEECMVDIAKIQELLSATVNPVFKTGIGIMQTADSIIITFSGTDLSEDDVLEFPININVFGRENIRITKEDFEDFVKGKDSDVTGEIKYDYKMLKEYVITEYPDFDKHLALKYDKKNNLVNAVMNVKEVKTTGKKETLYPVDGTVMSFFLHDKVTLSPDMFDGKTEVTEDELIEYAHSIYPEFAKGRAYIVYSKDDRLIMPMLKGSTKGALEKVTSEEELNGKLKSEYTRPFIYQKGNHFFRVENTPVSCTIADMSGDNRTGSYTYKLPKLSGKLYDQIDAFFRNVADVCETEVLLRLFWNIKTNEYEVLLPKQEVSSASVDEQSFDKDCRLSKPDCYAVGEIHSHCHYNAFFSAVDDNDEKGNKFYGVFGKYQNSDGSQFILRAGTGGYFVFIEKADIFTDESASQEEIDAFVEEMMKAFDENVEII